MKHAHESQGGISKATRLLHLTEDVFCGCNHMLRGARIRCAVRGLGLLLTSWLVICVRENVAAAWLQGGCLHRLLVV